MSVSRAVAIKRACIVAYLRFQLRSSNMNLLVQPRVNTGTANRAFSVAAPRIWNSLPMSVKATPTLNALNLVWKHFFSVIIKIYKLLSCIICCHPSLRISVLSDRTFWWINLSIYLQRGVKYWLATNAYTKGTKPYFPIFSYGQNW